MTVPTLPQSRISKLAVFMFCLAILISNAGCESQQRTTDYDNAIAAYEAGRYDTAQSSAVAAMAGERGRAKQRAAYVAGISAFRLRDFDVAENRLLTSVQSRDAQVAGRSYATLGLIRLNQGRRADADQYFRRAAEILPSVEAETARRSIRTTGAVTRSPAAVSADITPINHGGSLRRTSRTQHATSTPPYVLQVGAFKSQSNAEQARRQAEVLAKKHQLGQVRIVTRTNRATPSQTLYIVQLGRFDSKQQAIDMRRRLGRASYIVAEGL